jgi:hypothetical protein
MITITLDATLTDFPLGTSRAGAKRHIYKRRELAFSAQYKQKSTERR